MVWLLFVLCCGAALGVPAPANEADVSADVPSPNASNEVAVDVPANGPANLTADSPCDMELCWLGAQNLVYDERTLVLVKPDGVVRGLIGEIMRRFERRGYKLVAMKFFRPPRKLLETHYAHLKTKSFFKIIIDYMSSAPMAAMVWEGLAVVQQGRYMIGACNPTASNPGTIRGDFCLQTGRNIMHGSDTVENAKKEIALWFKKEDFMDYRLPIYEFIYEYPNEHRDP